MSPARAVIVTVAWLVLGAAGLLALLRFEKSPGPAATGAPADWPRASALAPAAMTLIMFTHPRCPCSRASLDGLASIMAQCRGPQRVYVLFMHPAGEPVSWTQSDLWRAAEAIPGVTVRMDEDGLEARRFHAATSGQTLLYKEGQLVFDGGLTPGRGHCGENPGIDTVMAWLESRGGHKAGTSVYGCGLLGPETAGGKRP